MSDSFEFSSFIGKNKIELESVPSTNLFLSELSEKEILPEGTMVLAKDQTMGRGQKGTIWHSEPGKNLIVSFLLKPEFLLISDQFLLSKMVALAVLKTIQKNAPTDVLVKIKWPNDIYINDRKITGILIENSVINSHIRQSIIGIGINVNQKIFPAEFHATSLEIINQKPQELDSIIEDLCVHLEYYYHLLKSSSIQKINSIYLNELYLLNEFAHFDFLSERIRAKIIDVDKNGKLQLLKEDDQRISADLKEIIFVREP